MGISKFHEIVHDLKSPLMSIEGFANLLLEEPNLQAKEQRLYIERILANVREMRDLLVKLQDEEN